MKMISNVTRHPFAGLVVFSFILGSCLIPNAPSAPFRLLFEVTSTCHPSDLGFIVYDPDERSPEFSMYVDDPNHRSSDNVHLGDSKEDIAPPHVILAAGEKCMIQMARFRASTSACDVTNSISAECFATFKPIGLLKPSVEPYEGQVPEIVTSETLGENISSQEIPSDYLESQNQR